MHPILASFSIFASKSIKNGDYPAQMSIHQLIREGRARLRLTEQEFADKVGVSRGAVQQWEKEGGTAPTRKNQPAVAALLGLSVAQLMGGGVDVATIGQAPLPNLDSALQALIGFLSQADPEDREALQGLFANLIRKPSDERLLGSIKLMLDSKAFVPSQNKQA